MTERVASRAARSAQQLRRTLREGRVRPLSREDDVIEEPDAEDLTRFAHPLGGLAVLGAGAASTGAARGLLADASEGLQMVKRGLGSRRDRMSMSRVVALLSAT